MKDRSAKRKGTSDRIIAAAGMVFAERGFRATTIRQITACAGVNIAAVNYHFRDKNELYIQVLREAKCCVTRIAIQDIPGNSDERLRGFISRFVRSLLDPERPSWHGRVISMEISNPSPALGILIREVTGPFYRDVRALIDEVVEGRANPEELDLLAISIFSQCVFYVCSRSMIEQLAVDLGRNPDRIERIASHIGDFSLAALDDFRRRPDKRPARSSRSRNSQLLLR